MYRFVALLVLCLLPLQWTFAAVSEYCKHETGPAEQQHVGHHSHQHVDPPVDDGDQKKASFDWDCPACHHAAGAAVPSIMASAPVPALPLLTVFSSRAISHRAPENPFRPPLALGS